jgi:S1-C subfamily serine protease
MSEIAFNPSHTARGVAVGFFAGLLTLLPSLIDAQITSPPTTRPLLDELNHETQDLFKQVSSSIVRVQMPMPTNFSISEDDLLSKWANRLDPQSLARLADIERRAPGTSYATAEIRPTTVPSRTQPTVGQQVIVLKLDRFSPNGVGIVLDDGKHLLIPRYVDKAACALPVPVAVSDGHWATASFVASDRQSDLTLLQLTNFKTKPATISADKPGAGTLLLVISLNPAANRLAVWEGWEPDVSALVNIDGTIAGFTKGGRFLSAAACSPVVEELMVHGSVRRAILGVVIDSVMRDDPVRRLYPALGATPALRINEVIPGSAAQHAGLESNDLILSLAGESVGDAPTFAAAIANRRGITPIAVLRDGQKHIVNVDLQVQ